MSPLESRVSIPVRWRDLDMLGHLNQSVYHEFLEEGRAELLARLHRSGRGFAFVLARVELDYRHEVRRDHGSVDVACRIARVGTKSITVENEIVLPDGTIAAGGTSILVAWDPKARTSRALTDEEREALSPPAAASAPPPSR
jgi:acyl-CoA thioester hydrolase